VIQSLAQEDLGGDVSWGGGRRALLAALLEEVRRAYGGRVVTGSDLDVF
jgi:hypothetical protein